VGGSSLFNLAEIIALLNDFAAQYPQFADHINNVIALLQRLFG
jgi:hypothetical protein